MLELYLKKRIKMRLINCFFDEFIEQVGDKKIFCFGYGAVAKIFLDILQDIGMENIRIL